MSEIYKIGYNKNNKIEKLFIFIGQNGNVKEEENDDGIEKIYVNDWIHLDDTIEAIHKKIVTAWNKKDNLISIDEIYTYFKQTERITTNEVYEKLSNNSIKNNILQPFLINIGFDIVEEDKKDFYEYDDILDLNLEDKLYDVSVPLGQQNILGVVTIPFNTTSKNITKNSSFSVKSDSKQLLLNVVHPSDNVNVNVKKKS